MKFNRTRVTSMIGVVAVALAPLMVGSAARGQDSGSDGNDKLTVMTRNIYLGADINRPVVAAATAEATGGGPGEILVALANASHETRAIVDQTDFRVRSGLLAREIDIAEPDLIGLQEVALWRSGPLQLDQVGVPNATTVDYDFLAILLDKLARRGENYRVAVEGNRADVEVPSFTGSPFDQTIGGNVRDVRLTTRDVILERVKSDLNVVNTADKVYDANLSIPVAGSEFNFDRGYQYVDIGSGSNAIRFVNTHLEAFSADLTAAQARQLLAESTPANGSSILVCDCNSDPKDSSVAPGDSVPNKAAYGLIAGQYADEWRENSSWRPGLTYGFSETVDDARRNFTQRIDFVFGRDAAGQPLDVRWAFVMGTSRFARDRATGLYPSDHGGVVMKLDLR